MPSASRSSPRAVSASGTATAIQGALPRPALDPGCRIGGGLREDAVGGIQILILDAGPRAFVYFLPTCRQASVAVEMEMDERRGCPRNGSCEPR